MENSDSCFAKGAHPSWNSPIWSFQPLVNQIIYTYRLFVRLCLTRTLKIFVTVGKKENVAVIVHWVAPRCYHLHHFSSAQVLSRSLTEDTRLASHLETRLGTVGVTKARKWVQACFLISALSSGRLKESSLSDEFTHRSLQPHAPTCLSLFSTSGKSHATAILVREPQGFFFFFFLKLQPFYTSHNLLLSWNKVPMSQSSSFPRCFSVSL